MTARQEEPEELDELTDEEEAELMDRLREAEEHPERLLSSIGVLESIERVTGLKLT